MALSWPPGCLLAAQTVALSGCHRHPGDPVHPSNSVLLSATHPPFCSVFRCLSGVPKVETRGAPLPLTAAAASLLPASRRVPGPVAGLYHTPPLLLPAATCGLPTPFSTSFPAHRSRSVLGEVALVLFGVVVGAWALSSLAWRLSWYGLNENAQPFQGYLWYNCTSPDLVTVVPDTPWVAWEGRVGRCGLPVLERTR